MSILTERDSLRRKGSAAIQPLLYTATQVSEILEISRAQAYKLMASGAIPTVTLGERSRRVPIAALQEWVALNTQAGRQ